MRSWLALLAFALSGPIHAAQAPPAAKDPVVEQRLMQLAKELRCLVCQNQSLADSDADLALDLRNQVREQIQAGRSDAQIRDWLTERYGDFVLYRPPVRSATVLLWAGPFLLLAGGLVALVVTLRRRAARAATPLTADERARAEALLHERPSPPAA